MSAESPNNARPELSAATQNIVTSQPVTDPTILDSVAGFINEVVPSTGVDYANSKDQIQWIRFENLDLDAPDAFSDPLSRSTLLLVLGYTSGVQVWAIPVNGEAIELFSWRHGSIKILRILPNPYDVEALGKRDRFESARPLIALVDVAMHSSSAGIVNFYSLKTGEQIEQIKFKSPVSDVVANQRSVAVTFPEKITIFDAFTLTNKLSVTTCYLSPGIHANPVALGSRWLAFAEKKLVTSRRSCGGTEGEGVQSYTATVFQAAKTIGRGLRDLGDVVASSLTGTQGSKLGTSPNSPQAGGSGDVPQKGIVTILDIENSSAQNAEGSFHPEAIVAHFVAHSEAVVSLQFGPCGMLLLTADKRGHDFNLFKIQPHPMGSALAAVHHLYTLHRGDTSARVQDMCFSFDSRWVTVSTLRGTTHVFPITPYGGNIGVRTHTTPHVVNKMSRFHRSAGLTSDGRSNSPVLLHDSPVSSNFPFHNPRAAPYPHSTIVHPLAQLRQPIYAQNVGVGAPRPGRQRLTSSSEDNVALRVAACFSQDRAWIDSVVTNRINSSRDTSLNKVSKPVESLFIVNCHGSLVQYDLKPCPIGSIPKEKVSNDTPIELLVTAKAQWLLQRQPGSVDRPLPLPSQNLAFVTPAVLSTKRREENSNDDDWLSQVEIITHAGPHRRLWMGPQFTFKTYTTTGTSMSLSDAQPLDLNRSKPVNMPITKANAVMIESGSASSSEQSLLDGMRRNYEELGVAGEHQIKEDLADAMMESPGGRDAGGKCVLVSVKSLQQQREMVPPPKRPVSTPTPIEMVVNPLGTVVTVHSDDDELPEPIDDVIIYENCDETLFRPLVTPKVMPYCRNSKADSGNIMTQSLKSDTKVTVSDKPLGSNWNEPKTQDIKGDTKILVQKGEVKDVCLLKALEEAYNDGSEPVKVQEKIIATAEPSNRKKNEDKASKKSEPLKDKKSKPVLQPKNEPVVKEELESKQKFKEPKLILNEQVKSIEKRIQEDTFEDSSYGLVNPLYNVLEECERMKSKKVAEPDTEETVTFSLSKSSKKLKNKKEDSSVCVKLEEPQTDIIEADIVDAMFILPKTAKSKKKSKPEDDNAAITNISTNLLNDMLIKEDDTELAFPPLDTAPLDDPEFPPLEESFFSLENLNKTDKYEDAEDCGLPAEPLVSHSNLSASLCRDDDKSRTSTSEDNLNDDKLKSKKGSLRKARKPKPKLGVKIGGFVKEDSPDKEASEEITLAPPPMRSWSSIAASKPPIDPWCNNNTSTDKLLDIDTPSGECDEDKDLLNLELEVHVTSDLLLKLSDDEKPNDSGSSPADTTTTTDSSDEGKVAITSDLMDKTGLDAGSGGKSNGKRKIRKKKK